ncbi:Glucose-induced degradation protein 8 like protein [Nosema granulosis]|uniref:Glucose-induced degradation protein 8 like protein n=1 Tax=Nosema granulosis TaxID=83296 RepID=A0A9P6KZX4_9MICR|nr:Glucose-induced degradation protein 8 like protein [Nosema granulosis]
MSSKEQKKLIDTENEAESVGGPSIFNTMCLNYMSYMGYGDVCKQFSEEISSSGETIPILERRTKIRSLIEQGEIDSVITEINDIDIEIIDKNYYVYYILMQHKAYEKASLIDFDSDSKYNQILDVLDYVKNELGQLVKDHEDLSPHLEDFLEYLVFNSSNIKIIEKRSQLADTLNRLILKKCGIEQNELEQIVKGILSEEQSLSKTNKFTDFKDIILD